MLDHLSLPVAYFDRATAFYDAVLAPLGYTRLMASPGAVGYGRDQKPAFWVTTPHGVPAELPSGFHLAFQAPDRTAVDRFHAAALALGAVDDGQPGVRPHYHSNYYAAYVRDPDGYRIEAVCQLPA
jgi:catechol 2,3-dioxygenase-like lactoylglutathione lyase family enzyme